MANKKMRQPTAKELKEGRAGKTKFMGSQRYLTKGDKPGEMVYSKPRQATLKEELFYPRGTGALVMSGPNKGTRRVTPVKSDVMGGRGKTNPPKVKTKPTSKGQIQSAANKEKIAKAAKAANKRSGAANRDTIKKNETIGQQRKRKQTNKDIDMGYTTIALESGGSIEDALKGKNKLSTSNNNQAKPPADYTKGLSNREIEIKMGIPNQSGMDTASTDAEGPKKKKMGGGQVYKRKHGGKVIKNNMSGQDLVNACYDN
jgi:hypothetical protein